jgi:hypothetical protein
MDDLWFGDSMFGVFDGGIRHIIEETSWPKVGNFPRSVKRKSKSYLVDWIQRLVCWDGLEHTLPWIKRDWRSPSHYGGDNERL